MPKLYSVDPSNYYQILGDVEISSPNEVKEKVKQAGIAQKEWGNLPVSERVKMLRNALTEFESRKSELALLVSREMGMPINEALNVDYQCGVDFANWYFDHAEEYLSPETTCETESEIHRVYHEPIGIEAAIVPWNYPFLNPVWRTWQSLLAGNTVVLKHSEECPLSGKFIEEVMSRHLPAGVFSEVYGDGKVGQLLANQKVDMIGFVGSAKTGWSLYRLAAKKRIKAVMELGGSAPGVIFDDADIDAAVKSACDYRLGNAGQWCDGLKRLIVHKNIFDAIVKKVADIFQAKKLGIAEKETTEIGPLVAERQLSLLEQQVYESLLAGARAITGGRSLEEEIGGSFYEPTVLIEVSPDMRVWKEEVFGPVLPIVSFSTEEEAIQLANNTDYGLGAYVYTQDQQRAQRVAKAIKSGMVSINGTNYTTPWNPFGGYKNSGIGREHGKYGFHEVTQVKVVARNK